MKWLDVRMQGVALANKDGMFGKSDPYLKFLAVPRAGKPVEVWKTEVINDDLNPLWKPFEVDMHKL